MTRFVPLGSKKTPGPVIKVNHQSFYSKRIQKGGIHRNISTLCVTPHKQEPNSKIPMRKLGFLIRQYKIDSVFA